MFVMKKFYHFIFSDNYILSGTVAGQYMLFSQVQKENGPRLFDPFFGFAYMGKLSSYRVIIFQNSIAQFDLTPLPNVKVTSMSWNYFSKNLSSLSFFNSSWNTGITWQVKIILWLSLMSFCFINVTD
jgi:hypothetical protein